MLIIAAVRTVSYRVLSMYSYQEAAIETQDFIGYSLGFLQPMSWNVDFDKVFTTGVVNQNDQ